MFLVAKQKIVLHSMRGEIMFFIGRRGMALLLCILLGLLGVHRMYAGKWKSGLIMLVCSSSNALVAGLFIQFFRSEATPSGVLVIVLSVFGLLFWVPMLYLLANL